MEFERKLTALKNQNKTSNPTDISNQLDVQKNYFDNFYSWDFRANEWGLLLEGMIKDASST